MESGFIGSKKTRAMKPMKPNWFFDQKPIKVVSYWLKIAPASGWDKAIPEGGDGGQWTLNRLDNWRGRSDLIPPSMKVGLFRHWRRWGIIASLGWIVFGRRRWGIIAPLGWIISARRRWGIIAPLGWIISYWGLDYFWCVLSHLRWGIIAPKVGNYCT